MLPEFLSACLLVALTVMVHAVGLGFVLRRLQFGGTVKSAGVWPVTWRIIHVAWALILIHLVEIALWGVFYWLKGCMPDAESAFYFSGVTYATVGYGDLVLPVEWRMLGPVEGLTGSLMVGLSTGFFFAMLSRLYAAKKTGE